MLTFIKNGEGKILNLFFQTPDKEYYLREIARYFGKEPAYYQSALNNLVKDGILIDERKGNLRFFKLNKNHPLYSELKKIVSKTIGAEGKLKELVNKLEGVEIAFIFGSFAKDKEQIDSDIDLMLIGLVNQDFLIERINELEAELKREVNYQIYDRQEVINKLKEKNSFFINVFNQPLIILKGNINEFEQFFERGEN